MSIDSLRLVEIEKEYWDFVRGIDFFEFLTPKNIEEQKKIFLKEFSSKNVYNPIFIYRDIRFDIKELLLKLEDFRERFFEIEHPISRYYEKYIDEDIDSIKNISKRSTVSFSNWLSQLYGFPEENDYKSALSILEKLDKQKSQIGEYSIEPQNMMNKIIEVLKSHNISTWRVKLKESSARLYVDPVKKEIVIKENTLFSPKEIKRLMLHEIGVHVLRYENGTKQSYMLFSKGFPNYLETEEGLAIYAEKRNGLLSDKDLAKYCCRLVAAYLCQFYDFYRVFSEINLHLDKNDSFDIVLRIKRGLIYSSAKGGFTKDQIYLKGLHKIEALETQVIKRLFIGKVGIEDLKVLDELEINNRITYPEWLVQND